MKPFIPTAFYGVLNYILSLTLIASPWLFGYADVSSAALLIPIYIGWLQFIMAVFVDNETGFVKQFPVPMHCFIDVVGGSFLLASPFVYDYSSHVVWPQLILGALVFFMGIFTKKSPLTDEPQHVFKDGLLNNISDVDEPMAHN